MVRFNLSGCFTGLMPFAAVLCREFLAELRSFVETHPPTNSIFFASKTKRILSPPLDKGFLHKLCGKVAPCSGPFLRRSLPSMVFVTGLQRQPIIWSILGDSGLISLGMPWVWNEFFLLVSPATYWSLVHILWLAINSHIDRRTGEYAWNANGEEKATCLLATKKPFFVFLV